MTELERIQASVAGLPPERLAAFREWFEGFKAAGRLDHLAEQALRDYEAGKCTEL